MPQHDSDTLLAAALDGDRAAWASIVDRYGGLVWSVARGFGLNNADAADVSQATWLRLVEHMHAIRDAERLGAWLATTARREALALLRRSGRDTPAGAPEELDRRVATDDPPDAGLLLAERDHELWTHFRALPESCQRLLRILIADPPPSYTDVAAALDMPVGSIGPTRGRCLALLRRGLQAGT